MKIAIDAPLLWEFLGEKPDELLDGSAKLRRVLTLILLKYPQCFVDLHGLLNESANLLFANVLHYFIFVGQSLGHSVTQVFAQALDDEVR